MLILIDLDGTLLNSVHPTWKPYKDGQDSFRIDNYLENLPFFPGAKEFLQRQKEIGNMVLIVSDSHPKYVEPICQYINCDCVSLADKPNKVKLSFFLDAHPDIKAMVESKDCVFIGDTMLDIELGRRIGIPTIWILPYTITEEVKNEKDKVGDEMACLKMGPTYAVKSFAEIQQILDNPINYLYAIESSFAGGESLRAILYSQNRFLDGTYAALRCLARQESGVSDKYARADKYYLIANPNRTVELLMDLAKGVSSYLNQPAVANQGWNYITYLTDKQTTVPRNKMKELFDMIETHIPKVQLLKWSDTVNGSLRSRNLYDERREFLEKYLSVDAVDAEEQGLFQKVDDDRLNIKGKNVVVIDDQLTTGATAWYVIHKLKAKGAGNILFIALFQMTLPVESEVLCPNCGKPMNLKIRRSDGYKFYSCTPPKFKGTGCGYNIDFQENNVIFEEYLKITKNNEWAFKIFIEGRKYIKTDMLQFVVDSEDKIQIISEMLTHPRVYISDSDIEELYKLRDKAKTILDNHPLRGGVWEEWAINHMNNDYWDEPKEVITWTLDNLEKLDCYIKNQRMKTKDILVLSMIKGVGPATIKKNIHRLKTEISAYDLIRELNPVELENISTYEKEAETIISICQKERIEIIDITSWAYPSSLLEISNPPAVLYVKGNKRLIGKNTIAIIGTRHSTELGNRIAERLGGYFSQHFVICNGLVEGIDEHSIYVNGKVIANTIGIISGGLCYKSTCSQNHIRVIQDVLNAGGLIMSEYPPLKKEDQYTGSTSSRIQAGLSSAIILVQSRINGGSKYTLDKFVKLGRVVGVVNFPTSPEFQDDIFEANRLIVKERESGLAKFVGLKTDKKLNVRAIIPITSKENYEEFAELTTQLTQLKLMLPSLVKDKK